MAQVLERATARSTSRFGQRIAPFVQLTKPSIIELLLVTTVPAMFLAAGGWPEPGLIIATLLGGSLSAGAANVFNMVLDRDIDAIMTRTQRRPIPSGRVSVATALVFGSALAVAGSAWLWFVVGELPAVITTAGMLFYVLVYTALLKRRTVQNIVIGGAAGAVPALVGWAAVAGDLDASAWVLFTVVFLWTPPHFWALAVVCERDYRAAAVPMLPVVRGGAVAARSSLRYAVATVATSFLLLFTHNRVGWIYLIAASCLGALFIGRALQFRRDPTLPVARRLFRFSIVYLGALSLAIILDQVAPPGG